MDLLKVLGVQELLLGRIYTTTKQKYPPLLLVNFLWFVGLKKDSAFPLVEYFCSVFLLFFKSEPQVVYL